jgi:hypothetical protein
MPGTHVIWSKVSANIVELAKNKLLIARGFRAKGSKFDSDFNEGPPGGNSVTVKLPFRSTIREGWQWNGQNVARQSTTITADQVFGADLNLDPDEQALYAERSWPEFRKNVIEPIAAQIATEVDLRAARFGKLYTSMVHGALGTNPTTSDDFAAPRSRLTEMGAMITPRRKTMAITPAMMRAWISGTPNLLSLFYIDPVRKAFNDGYIGHYGDFDVVESMSLQNHTTGVWATVATGVTVLTSGQSGSTINFAATTGDTLKAGDKISIASVNAVNPMTRESLGYNRQFTVLADITAASNAFTGVSIHPAITGPGSAYQNVDALPVAAAVVTLMPGTSMSNAAAKTGKFGMAFTDEAFAMVSIDVPQPKTGFEMIGGAEDPDTGLKFAMLCWFDPKTLMKCWRWDVYIGFGALRAAESSLMIAGLR